MARARATNDSEWVTSIRPSDVLFGRGSGPNDHEGNILFRKMVKERKSEYMSTNHRQTKSNIAHDIVNAVRARNGRFLKKAEPKDISRLGIPEGVDAWLCVDEPTILEKAKQALRQKEKARTVMRLQVFPTERSFHQSLMRCPLRCPQNQCLITTLLRAKQWILQ